VITASLAVSGCANTVAGHAVRAKGALPLEVPELDESKLDNVLLSIGELNGILGASQMRITADVEEMTDHHSSDVSDPDCLGAIYGAAEPVYAPAGWTAVRDQVASEPGDDNEHWVEQIAVLYPSADKAHKFFESSKAAWGDCADSDISVDDLGDSYTWSIDKLTVEGNLLTQLTTQQDAGGWACQHALSAVSNLTVETWACGYNFVVEAATVATEMIANAAKK